MNNDEKCKNNVCVEKHEYKLDKEKMKKLGDFIDSIEDKEGALINILHEAQDIFGYLPEDVQLFVARKLGITAAKVYGVVTFYSYFTMEPRGKHVISICMGTACFVKGAEKVLQAFMKELNIEEGYTTEDGMFTISSLRCVGACGLAPVVVIDGKIFGKVKPEEVKQILDEYRK